MNIYIIYVFRYVMKFFNSIQAIHRMLIQNTSQTFLYVFYAVAYINYRIIS